MKRPYQMGFYELCPQVRDPRSRREKAEKIVKLLNQYAGFPLFSAICLDIGCSSGLISSVIAPFVGKMIGLEYDIVALRSADQDIRKRVQLTLGDAMHLPFRESSFDVVICAQVYEHVPDDIRLFDEIHRVLKAGGIVFFSGPNWLFPIEPHYHLPFLHWLPEQWADLYLRITRRGTHYYERPRHIWGLRRLVIRFITLDVTREVLISRFSGSKIGKLLGYFPEKFWEVLKPLVPNFNWILRKPLH
jgi:Methylase involved in ubiquinone/menaquinone biosynthesis